MHCSVSCMPAQLCPTLGDPTDCSPPGSSVQARILELVTISSSRGSSGPRDQTYVSYRQVDSLPLSHLGDPQDSYMHYSLSRV